MILDSGSGQRIEIDNPLFIDIDGQRVPFFVEKFDLVSIDQAIVKLEFINSIEEAREVSGCEVYVEPATISTSLPTTNGFNVLVGYKAFDQDLGYLGKITDYVQHNINSILIVDYNGLELLIPAVDELIIKINHKEQSIHFQLPEGLTTL